MIAYPRGGWPEDEPPVDEQRPEPCPTCDEPDKDAHMCDVCGAGPVCSCGCWRGPLPSVEAMGRRR